MRRLCLRARVSNGTSTCAERHTPLDPRQNEETRYRIEARDEKTTSVCAPGSHGKMGDVAKLLLLSVVMAMIAVPILTSRDTNPQRGLKKTLLLIVAFNLLYLFLVRYVYPSLQ